MTRQLTLLVHGEAGAGKSWLTNSAPGPRLFLDVEGRAQYLADLRADSTGRTPQKLVYWDPAQPIPAESADKDTVTVVRVRAMRELSLVMKWLKKGQHPFRSAALDSITRLQMRHVEKIAGTDQMQIQDWGTLLRDLQNWLCDFIDLREHPTKPILSITVVGGSHNKDDLKRLMLQGQLSNSIAFLFDVVGYLNKGLDTAGQRERFMIIDGFVDGLVAKDDTHILTLEYGDKIVNPDITAMLRMLNPKPKPTEGEK